MEFNPSRWPVSLAGFLYDWTLTREWKGIRLAILPLVVLATVAGMVWAGGSLDRSALARWYLELGDQEIAGWEESWAPSQPRAAGAATGEAAAVARPDNQAQAGNAAADTAQGRELTRFAEVLFRRVQLLEPSNRSQFVIGATLSQHGISLRAIKMLTKIAPEQGAGYPPAHAFLAMMYLRQYKEKQLPALLPVIKHHAQMAAQWDRVPEEVLLVGSELCRQSQDPSAALNLYEQAAQRNPNLYVGLARLAQVAGNKLLAKQAREKAELHYQRRLAANELDDQARTALAELHLNDEDGRGLDRAEELLRAGERLQPTGLLSRALSEVYRLRFIQSKQQVGATLTADVQMLDIAMRIDPTNPLIPQEVARLALWEGVDASAALIEKLKQFLAEGKATAVTHAWLSEAYLVRKDYEKAIPHLQQVVTRLPNAAQYLNNLAYVLAELHPDRMEEALALAKRAVTITASAAPNPDYYDTLGSIFGKLGKTNEAIASFESAIQLAPDRVDFHERVAEQYRRQGDEDLAAAHEKVIADIIQAKAEAAAASLQDIQPLVVGPADPGTTSRAPADSVALPASANHP